MGKMLSRQKWTQNTWLTWKKTRLHCLEHTREFNQTPALIPSGPHICGCGRLLAIKLFGCCKVVHGDRQVEGRDVLCGWPLRSLCLRREPPSACTLLNLHGVSPSLPLTKLRGRRRRQCSTSLPFADGARAKALRR